MKRSVTYASGSPVRLKQDDVTNVNAFTSYARQELGLAYPVGNGRREAWLKFLRSEIEIQAWSYAELVHAVDYIKATRRKCRTLQGILWYVDEARDWAEQRTTDEYVDLHAKVARALNVEKDDTWIRRLSLARGEILSRVYADWEAQYGS